MCGDGSLHRLVMPPSPEILREFEVKWYRAHGKYPNYRITRNAHEEEMMIGDWSWNRRHVNHREYVERLIPYAKAVRHNVEVSDAHPSLTQQKEKPRTGERSLD